MCFFFFCTMDGPGSAWLLRPPWAPVRTQPELKASEQGCECQLRNILWVKLILKVRAFEIVVHHGQSLLQLLISF